MRNIPVNIAGDYDEKGRLEEIMPAAKKPRKLLKTQSHKEHGKMGNPNPPQSEEFKSQQFKALGELDQPLGDKVWGIRLPVDVEETLKAMEAKERVIWMRKILVDAARQELMSNK